MAKVMPMHRQTTPGIETAVDRICDAGGLRIRTRIRNLTPVRGERHFPQTRTGRHSAVMPRPHPHLTPDVSAAIAAIGADAMALLVVRHLIEHGPTGTPDLAAALGVTENPILRRLKSLEAAGIVTANYPDWDRVGRSVRYTAHQHPLHDHLRKLIDWTTPGARHPTQV
jgi:DNA-binding HxlR family transcriptional regulator